MPGLSLNGRPIAADSCRILVFRPFSARFRGLERGLGASGTGWWGRSSHRSSELGVVVFDVFLILLVLACALVVSVVLANTVSRRLVHSREERLKAHLDWVNPVPQTSRKRGLARR